MSFWVNFVIRAYAILDERSSVCHPNRALHNVECGEGSFILRVGPGKPPAFLKDLGQPLPRVLHHAPIGKMQTVERHYLTYEKLQLTWLT